MRPVFIPNTVRKYYQTDQLPLPGLIRDIALKFKRLLCDEPEVSIVIPAYNEEDNILKMLASLSDSSTNKKLEIIVVNNNSSDSTGEIAKATGVICIDESQQGITAARNAGLSKAKGGYIINADADTIYPPDWIDHMVNPLI